MNDTRDISERIDIALSNKKDSEMLLIFLMLFVFIGFITYMYVFPITTKELKTTKRNLKFTEKKILKEKNYLKSVTRNGDDKYFIKKAKRTLIASQVRLEKKTYMNTYIDGKLKNLSYLLFNNKNWAKFLDSVSKIAQKDKVSIKIIENKINKPSIKKIEQILTLKVKFNGKFKNIMQFINDIEESKLVVDIYNLSLKSSKGIDGNIDIAVWGMKY